jgi:hypothetical protein
MYFPEGGVDYRLSVVAYQPLADDLRFLSAVLQWLRKLLGLLI